jgi:hypothetical protein
MVLVQMCIAKEMGLNETQIVARIGHASNLICFDRMHDFCNFRYGLERENSENNYL